MMNDGWLITLTKLIPGKYAQGAGDRFMMGLPPRHPATTHTMIIAIWRPERGNYRFFVATPCVYGAGWVFLCFFPFHQYLGSLAC